ncbi:MAG: TatD family hydrolase [Victivallales bacterium]|nr:TatD family hydrolase [Victivallales bacterium]
MTCVLPLVDCHCHLADARLANERISIVKDCATHQVQRILINGTCPQDWQTSIDLARQFDFDASVGLHPFMAEMWNDIVERKLCDCISSNKVRAIGEIGLDAPTGGQSDELLRNVFLRQLDIAMEARLPVALHIRVPWNEFFDLLSQKGITCIAGYCHNFTGSWEIARRLLDLGLCLSFNTSILRGKRVLKAVENVPLDCILTETDTPDMPFNDEAKRPWHVRTVLEKLAEIRHCSIVDLSNAVLSNYNRIFKTT